MLVGGPLTILVVALVCLLLVSSGWRPHLPRIRPRGALYGLGIVMLLLAANLAFLAFGLLVISISWMLKQFGRMGSHGTMLRHP